MSMVREELSMICPNCRDQLKKTSVLRPLEDKNFWVRDVECSNRRCNWTGEQHYVMKFIGFTGKNKS